MTLLYLVTAWVAGIVVATKTQTSLILWLGIAGGTFLLAYLARHNRGWRLTWLCAALFMLGAARHTWATRPLPDDHIAHYTGTGYITLTGVVEQMPDVRDQHVNLRVTVETLTRYRDQRPAQGLVLVQAPRYGPYKYGDRVRVSGTLLTPPEFDDFSYRDYLARQGIHAMIPNARVDVLAHNQGQPWYAAIYDLKSRAQHTIASMLPSPQAPLLSGILLGVETGISDDVRDAFNTTGTAHVIAISGSNIIIVIGVLLALLKPVAGTRRANVLTIAGVAIYALFVGADAAVIRAAIMGTVAIIGAQMGRQAYSKRARTTYGLTTLAASAWLMTLHNPYTLWDVGFQLSVAATAGLVIFGSPFNDLLASLLRRGFSNQTARQITHWLSEPLTVSLAAQIATAPLILFHFGRLSILGLVANILIIPAQPYIMTLGGLAMMLGLLWLPLGEFAAWIVWLPLTYTIEIVRAFATYDMTSIPIEITLTGVWGIYAMLLLTAALVRLHPDDRASLVRALRQRLTTGAIIISGIVLTLLVWLVALSQPDRKLHVWFLDVGNGHAVLIQTPDGAQILIDGGPNPTRLRRAIGDALPFWDRDLDMLMVTQPRNDAIGALPALLDRYTFKLAITNGQPDSSANYTALLRTLQKRGVEVVQVTAGYRIETGDRVVLDILHPQSPPAPGTTADENAIVVRVGYGDASFLLTPVLDDNTGENILNAGWYASSTVLESPSYGKAEANSLAFLTAVDPQVSVVSVGAGNRSGLPDSTTIERLQQLTGQPIFRTDQHGTIEMVTDGHTLWIYPES